MSNAVATTSVASATPSSSYPPSRFSTASSVALGQVNPPSSRLSELNVADGPEEHVSQQLRPTDRGKGAWGFVAAAFLLECFLWGFSYSYSTVLVFLQKDEKWGRESLSSLAAIGTTMLGLQLLLPIFIIPVFHRYGDWVKTILWCSAFVSCASMLVSSWATEVWQLILLQGVLCGTADAILYTPVFIWVNEWFVARRGLAWGIIMAGTGLGGFIFPWLLDGLLEGLGYPWMCRIWAAITAVVFIPSVYLVKPRIPPASVKGNRGRWIPPVNWRFLRSPVFIFFGLCCLFSALSWMPVSIYAATYADSFNTSTTTTNLVVGLLNLFACIGAALAGFLSDYSYSLTNVLCGLGAALVSLAAWGFADSLGKTVAFVAIFGLVSQQNATWSGATRELAAQDPMTSTLIVTLYSVVRGIASLVMPVVSDALYNPSLAEAKEGWGRFGFENIIVFVGINGFLLALAGLAVGWASKQRAKQRRNATTGL